MPKTEARILDELHALRDEAHGRIMDLINGSNHEDDNIFQILDSVLLEAYITGRNERKDTYERRRQELLEAPASPENDRRQDQLEREYRNG